MPEARRWFGPALALVLAVTAWRLVLLAFNRTDLFVDEAQYWLWGQSFDWGYYSKPPLIAWVIGGVTWAAGSDAAFWVRSPGAVLHGATALILAAWAAEVLGPRAAPWVAAAYVTLPFTTVGSLLISTDTVMAPFFAGALWAHARAVREGGTGAAVLAGALAGLAVLGKYMGVMTLAGFALAALVAPSARLSARQWAGLLAAFGAVVAPNLVWNAANDLVTVSHTMDNAGWVRGGPAGVDALGSLRFVAEQFAVAGPVIFAAYLLALALGWAGEGTRRLIALSLPPLALVTVQAALDKAYANWAVAAYLAGTLLVVAWLEPRGRAGRRWLAAGIGVNAVVALVLPVLTLVPEARLPGREAPILARWLGQADLSAQILAAAAGRPILAERREVLADLWYRTGGGEGVVIHAPRPVGRPMNFYEQTRALPAEASGPLFLVAERAPVCNGVEVAPEVVFDTAAGTYAHLRIAGYGIDAACLAP